MDNPVFVFGTFSEDEASHFQFRSPPSRKKESRGRALSGVNSPKSSSSQDAANVSSSAPKAAEATCNGHVKREESTDLGVDLATLSIKEEACSVSCHGRTDILSDKHHVGNGCLTDKEVLANGNFSSLVHGVEHENDSLHSESNSSTPPGYTSESNSSTPHGYTSHGRASFNDNIPDSSTKAVSKSWASLLDDEASGSPRVKDSRRVEVVKSKVSPTMQLTELSGDLWLRSLKEVDITGKRLQPRGLINKGNLCFLNATLQALLSCSSFVHLLHTLHGHGVPEVGYPALRACVDFFNEFEFEQHDVRSPKAFLDVGKPIVPSMFDGILHELYPHQPATGAPRSRQEDAQEFLSLTMNRLHDELLRLDGNKQPVAAAQNMPAEASEEDDWETVGRKNRTAVVRTHTLGKSALSDIFRGELCSVVKTKGNKASATVQPFLVLHMDILPEAVHTVEDALRLFAAPETLEGYRATAGKAVSASKSVKIQALPQVLILHVKRFSYGAQGSSKLHKLLHFPFNLTLGRDLLAIGGSASESRNYELVATVTHHGKDPSRGHYTAHSKQLSGQWLRYDDGVVSTVGLSRVLQDLVYLLFYKRVVNTQ